MPRCHAGGVRPGAPQGRGFGRGCGGHIFTCASVSLGAEHPPGGSSGAQVRPRPLQSPPQPCVYRAAAAGGTNHLPPLMDLGPGALTAVRCAGERLLPSGCNLRPQAPTPSPAAHTKDASQEAPAGAPHPREGAGGAAAPLHRECSGQAPAAQQRSQPGWGSAGPHGPGQSWLVGSGAPRGCPARGGAAPLSSPAGPWASPQFQAPAGI